MSFHFRRFLVGCVAVAAFTVCADTVKTNVWITLGGGNWSNAANWENGEKPAADGSSFVIVTNDLVGSGVWVGITLDENASVRGIRYLQGKAPTYAPSFGGKKTLTIGADGVYGQNWGTYDAYDSSHGRQMNIGCPVVLGAGQIWQDHICGVGHGDWVQTFNGPSLSGAPDVNWLVTGMKHTIDCGSSSFLGTLYPQRSVCFAGANRFSFVPRAVLCNTNCFNSAFPTADPRLSYRFTGSGTGYVATEFVFDADHKGMNAPYIASPSTNPTNENRLVFTGKWSGAALGYGNGPAFTGNGDQYGNGHMYAAGFDGMFRPSAMQWWFDNDMAEYVQTNKNIQIPDIIIVLKHANAWKNVNFFISKGRAGRLKGVLTANGRNFSNSVSVYEWNYSASDGVGATLLVGLAEAGYAEFGGLTIGLTSTYGEKPVWLYAPDGGTVRFKTGFSYSGWPLWGHYLPYQIWGGGTVIMSAEQNSFWKGRAPFYVRDGRLVVGGTGNAYGVSSCDVQVGVRPPSTIAVRALEMEVVSATYSADFQTLAFSKVRKPDGVTLVEGDRVLVNIPTDNVAPKYNGVYVVGADTKVWTRAPEMNDPAQCAPDIRVTVAEGATFGGTSWFLHNESRRWCDIHGEPYATTLFNNSNYCVAFLQEPHNDPDVALLLESGRTLTNRVDVLDNLSAGTTTLGAYDENKTARFTGPMTILKPSVVLTAPSGSTCSFEGTMTGAVAVVKTGAGAVVVNPSDANLTITNLTVEAGTITVPSARLAPTLRTAEFAFGDGATAEMRVSGDLDLSNWTFTVTGLDKPIDRDFPPTYDIRVTSVGGSVTGEPRFVLKGPDTRRWAVRRTADGWQVYYSKPGFAVRLDVGSVMPVAGAIVVRNAATGKTAKGRSWYAASLVDLTNAMTCVTGQPVPVYDEGHEPADAPAAIYLGETSAAEAAGIDGDGLRKGDWQIRIVPGRAYLYGRTGMAAAYAVSDFLERYLGFHYLTPYNGPVYSADPACALPAADLVRKPALYSREIYHGMYNGYTYPTLKPQWEAWCRRRRAEPTNEIEGEYRCCSAVGDCHTIFNYLPPETFFATHPEWYSMDRKGVRRGVRNQNSQICYTNPDARNEIYSRLVAYIQAEYASHPDDPALIFDMSQMDNCDHLCLCPDCKAVIAKYNRVADGHAEGGDAGLQLEFVNDLARRIRDDYPDVRLRVFAYVSSECPPPPESIVPEPNVIIHWCDVYGNSCHLYPLQTPGHFNLQQAEELDGWRALTANLHVWDYMLGGGVFSAVDAISADARFFGDRSVSEMFMEVEYDEQPFYFIQAYLMSALYDDPNRRVHDLLKTFFRQYGRGAAEMKAVYRFMGEIQNAEKCNDKTDWSSRNFTWTTPANYERIVGLCETAYAKETDPAIRPLVVMVLQSAWKTLLGLYRQDPAAAEKYELAKEKVRRWGKEWAATGFIEETTRAVRAAEVDDEIDFLSLRFDDLPAAIRSAPRNELICLDFHAFESWQRKDDDPNAYRGLSLRTPASEDFGSGFPFACGVYDWKTKKHVRFTVAAADLPADGFYHWVHLGTMYVGSDTRFYFPGSWNMTISLFPYRLIPDGLATDPNWYDLWVSFAVKGPVFNPASSEANAIRVDRLALRRVAPPTP